MDRLASLSLCFAVAGCAHATPVTPAPLAAADVASLQAALVGTCSVTATQTLGGERKTASGLSWTFSADGNANYHLDGSSSLADFTYRIDGRNVMMTGPYKAMRVDQFDGPTMTWFLYDTSEYYYCTKRL
jgi:hypothetical protein